MPPPSGGPVPAFAPPRPGMPPSPPPSISGIVIVTIVGNSSKATGVSMREEEQKWYRLRKLETVARRSCADGEELVYNPFCRPRSNCTQLLLTLAGGGFTGEVRFGEWNFAVHYWEQADLATLLFAVIGLEASRACCLLRRLLGGKSSLLFLISFYPRRRMHCTGVEGNDGAADEPRDVTIDSRPSLPSKPSSSITSSPSEEEEKTPPWLCAAGKKKCGRNREIAEKESHGKNEKDGTEDREKTRAGGEKKCKRKKQGPERHLLFTLFL